MSEKEFVSGKCKVCGGELRVPADLEKFSCMYCGAKLTQADLVEELPPVTPAGDLDELTAHFTTHMIDCVAKYPDYRLKISRKEYEPAFEAYERECRGVFESLDTAVQIAPERRDELISQAITCFLDQLEAYWTRTKTRGKSLSMMVDDDKMTIAIFMVPMIGHLNLSVSEDFSRRLQKEWVARHPKSPFYVGSYDDISGGFRKKWFKFCFITTAVCEELGKPDDCEELTAFRAFRDGYLLSCPDGQALIDEYYDIAPGIVTCISLCGDRHERYTAIRDKYLAPCYEDLRAGRDEACKKRYVRMVRDLEKQYLS